MSRTVGLVLSALGAGATVFGVSGALSGLEAKGLCPIIGGLGAVLYVVGRFLLQPVRSEPPS